MKQAIGMIELSSIAVGYVVQDAMLKSADVQLILGRTICSGKYMTVIGGDIAGVTAAVEAGQAAAPDGIIDTMIVPNIHEDIFPALGQSVQLDGKPDAIGVVESYSAASMVEAADAAAKAADVTIFRLHLAMALGGKAFMLLAGSIASCQAAVEAAEHNIREKGLLVGAFTIANPSVELMQEYI
jgi:microcompartment protein CcmL/EutN